MLSHTHSVNSSQLSSSKQLLEASVKRNEFLLMTVFPYLQPIRDLMNTHGRI